MLSVSLRSVKAIQLYLIFFVFSLYVVHIKLIFNLILLFKCYYVH